MGVNVNNCDPNLLQSFYSSGMLISLADGSVRGVSTDVSQRAWNLALNSADGLPLDSSW